MAITQQEASNFYHRGRDIMTEIAKAADDGDAYNRTFEVRGGAGAMPEFATETGQIIQFLNDLNVFLASQNAFPQHMLDLHRTDY